MEQNMNLNDMGRIWLSRKILHWQHFGQPSYLTVFITLLLVANHREQWWKGVKVNRGETVISVKSLCKLCKDTAVGNDKTVNSDLYGFCDIGKEFIEFHVVHQCVDSQIYLG